MWMGVDRWNAMHTHTHTCTHIHTHTLSHTRTQVNVRLMAVEAKYGHSSSGDPLYPKAIFPSMAACPKCGGQLHATTAQMLAAATKEGQSKVWGGCVSKGRVGDHAHRSPLLTGLPPLNP